MEVKIEVYIHEAVEKALENDGVIYRKSAKREEQDRYAVIKPTNSYETCILIVCAYDKPEKSARSWNPTADDLAADDWECLEDKYR